MVREGGWEVRTVVVGLASFFFFLKRTEFSLTGEKTRYIEQTKHTNSKQNNNNIDKKQITQPKLISLI